jgi:hypothetical protein
MKRQYEGRKSHTNIVTSNNMKRGEKEGHKGTRYNTYKKEKKEMNIYSEAKEKKTLLRRASGARSTSSDR